MVLIQYQLLSAIPCHVNTMNLRRWSCESELWQVKRHHHGALRIKGRRSHFTRNEKRMSAEKEISKPPKKDRKVEEDAKQVDDPSPGNNHKGSEKSESKSLKLVQRIEINIGRMRKEKPEESDENRQSGNKIRLQVAFGGFEDEKVRLIGEASCVVGFTNKE